MKTKKFESEYGYSIKLPENWFEYDLDEDEKNTNGFFNGQEWSGNLRITPFSSDNIDDYEQFIYNSDKEENSVKINWNNIKGISYSNITMSGDYYIYFWNLTKRNQNRMYICSFTIDLKDKDSKRSKKELKVVETILKSLETE
jgi:hypothetical protein